MQNPHIYFWILQSFNDVVRFRKKIFPVEITEILHLYTVMIRLKSQLHFIHVLKDAKPQGRRALLASASDDLIKAIVECASNAQYGNHKLTKDENSKLQEY
jgi:hypothetical protein